MASELEISLNFNDVFYSLWVLFHDFQNLYLQLKLIVQIFALFEDLQSVFFLFAIITWFMVDDFENLTKSPRTKDFNDLEPVCDMVTNYWFVIILLVSKALLLIFSEISLVPNVVNILVVFYLFLFELCQVHVIQVVSDDWFVIQLFDTERRKLFFYQFV